MVSYFQRIFTDMVENEIKFENFLKIFKSFSKVIFTKIVSELNVKVLGNLQNTFFKKFSLKYK